MISKAIQWRPVSGYEGFYEVSNDGQVRSLDRYVGPRGGVRLIKGAVLSPAVDRIGRRRVSLRKFGKATSHLIAPLVLTAFVGPRPPGLKCCHNDGNTANNSVLNLRWDTQQSNVEDAVRHGTLPRGERHWAAKLTDSQVEAICADTRLQAAIATEYRVSQSTVSLIKSGKRKVSANVQEGPCL